MLAQAAAELLEEQGRAVGRAKQEEGVDVREVDRMELDRLASDHQGVVAEVASSKPIGERELATRAYASDAIVVVLDGLRAAGLVSADVTLADVAHLVEVLAAAGALELSDCPILPAVAVT